MAIWYTSDLHFGDKNIIDFCDRPFDNTDDMDEALVENYNSVIKDDDIVYFLGDIAMGDRAAGLEHVKRLKGRKIMIPGNHDFNHPMHKPSVRAKWMPIYKEAFDSVIESYPSVRHTGEYKLLMSHFPSQLDWKGDQERYSPYSPDIEDDEWLLCGHIHNHWKLHPEVKNINVGVDVWGLHPVSRDQIFEVIRESGR